MSADNEIVIFKCNDGKYRGWMGFWSDSTPDERLHETGPEVVEADTLEAAYDAADGHYTEYGVRESNVIVDYKPWVPRALRAP